MSQGWLTFRRENNNYDKKPGPRRPVSRALTGHSNNHQMNTSINPNKALWEKGDFTRIAASMRESGEALVNRLGITKGMKVLDLGCGDGTTAIPAAKLWAHVMVVDMPLNL